MKKLIFCNLDLLKSNLDPADYQDLDLSDFNFEHMKKKRDKYWSNINNVNVLLFVTGVWILAKNYILLNG